MESRVIGLNSSGRVRWFNAVIMLIDLVVLYGGLILAYIIRFPDGIPDRNLEPFLEMAPWLGILAVVIFYLFDLYSTAERQYFHKLVYSIFMSVALFMAITVVFSFWIRGFALPRSVIMIGTVIELVLMVLVRTGLWYIQLKLNGRKKTVIIGYKSEGERIAGKIMDNAKDWLEIKYYLTMEQLDSLVHIIDDIDVILISDEIPREKRAEIFSISYNYKKEILVVPNVYDLFMIGSQLQQIDDMLVLSVKPPKLGSGERLLKRALDLAVSIVGLVIMSPVMLLLLILIPLNSKGSPIFKQERLGRNGKPFVLYKFRSMVMDAEKKSGAVLATQNDPRITSLGKFLRASRLDELPQLINVIKGDMSLVGPRPEREFFVNQFAEEIPGYVHRMAVKPGITGLAQVMAKYSTIAEDKLRYDLLYIMNYSFLLDLKILLQTFVVMVRREQASGIKSEATVSKIKNRTINRLDRAINNAIRK